MTAYNDYAKMRQTLLFLLALRSNAVFLPFAAPSIAGFVGISPNTHRA
ncbi:hypothetical protein [Methylovulum psychrotolerans]|nr:hypothetical protein [Methylovulum psychrotolerans]